jgi:hypothetical protein
MKVRVRIAALLAMSALAAGALRGVAIEGMAIRSFNETQLTTLGEYLGGHEYYGRRTYLRTDPAKRAGLYIVVDFDTKLSKLQKGSVVMLDYIRASDGQTVSVSLPLADARGCMGKALYIGITDLEKSGEKLLAWRISVVDAAGAVEVARASFLWQMP